MAITRITVTLWCRMSAASDELEVVKTIDLPYPINLWILTKQELKGKPGIQETMRFFATHGRPLLSS